MAATRSMIKALYLAHESGGFGVDPSADGSSGYTAIQTEELGFPVDQTQLLDTRYMTGRARRTKRIVGPDGAQIEFSTPLSGLAAAAGDGTAAPAEDWLSLVFNHMMGTATGVAGEGLSGANAGDFSLDTDTVLTEPFDLVPIWESGVNSNIVQWRRATNDSSPYAIHRNFDDTPSGSAIAYGHHLWIHADRPTRTTLAAYVLMDDTPYTLLGGAITSAVISMQAGQKATLRCTAQFDSKSQSSKASIPDITPGNISTLTPIIGELASVEFNGTEYAASSVEIDLGLNVIPVQSVAGSNGRSNMLLLEMSPVIRFTPQFQTGIETAFRAGTTGRAMVRFGSGTVSGGILNSIAVYSESVQIDEPPNAQDDGGLVRQQVVMRCIDPGLDGDGDPYPYLMIARA